MRGFLKKIKNTVIYLTVVLLLYVFKIIPLMCTDLILRAIAIIAYHLPIRENRIARINLSFFYSDRESEQILKRMYFHWAESIKELFAILYKKIDIKEFATLTDESRKTLDEALSEQKGIIFLTAHLGNWEIMAVKIAKEGYDTNTIAKESYDERFTRIIKKMRESNGVKCIFRNEENLRQKIKGVIERNAIMGFLIDQNTRVPSVMVDFLGKKAPTPVIPVRLLKETGAALIVGYNHRINGRIITYAKRLSYSMEEDEHLILKRVNDILSEEIKKYPYEWIWVHNRWNISR